MFARQGVRGRVVSQLLVILALIMVSAPLLMIIAVSLRGEGLANYVAVIQGTPFLRFILNSAILAGATVAIVLVLTITSAFALEVLRPLGSGAIALAILAGLALPGVAILIPVYSLMQALELFNTFWAVIFPLAAISVPLGLLLASNHIRELPSEIFEAARIDGASNWRLLVSVVVPLSLPILAVVAIFTFLNSWNEYLLPLVFLQDPDLQVATQVPTYFQGDRLIDVPKIFAANILVSLPVVTVYLLLQRQFRKGLAGGAVK
jgi:raffinose/stachyose/melibiose transport system permease protein